MSDPAPSPSVPAASIVVPCFNEAPGLPALVASFEALREPASDWELVLVDNGSTDGSGEVLRGLSRPWLRVVTVPAPNVGYGHGIVAGLRESRGNWLAWTHADGQTPPSDVLEGLRLLRASAEPGRTVVKGRRVGRALPDVAFTMGMSVAGRLLLGRWLDDVNGQPKCFPRALFERFRDPPTDLSLDLYLLWLAAEEGFTLQAFDVRFGARAHGESKWAFSWRSKARHVRRTLVSMRAMRESTR